MSPKKLLFHSLCVLAGTLAAEAFVRGLIASDAMFEVSFSPGARKPHDTLGAVFTPNFDGWMRHPDKVWAVPLELDRHGYRPEECTEVAASSDVEREEEVTRVVLLGGRSMTMCYGLPQKDTIQARMVANADRPLCVANTGWAGTDPFRSWLHFLEELDGEKTFDVLLLCLNPGGFEPYANLPEDFTSLPPHPLRDGFFYMMPGNLRMPNDSLERWMGPSYFSSYVLYGLLRYRAFVPIVEKRLRLPREHASDQPDPDRAEEGRLRFTAFVEHVRDHFAGRSTRVAVVFLASILHPKDAYADFDRLLPADVPSLDLQRMMRDDLRREDFIAGMHYGDVHVERIARELNRFVDELTGP